jgi:hypothetical protein
MMWFLELAMSEMAEKETLQDWDPESRSDGISLADQSVESESDRRSIYFGRSSATKPPS